ncbi:hypothetical protein P3342_011043 [Pyrenophora teres f. teres]|uniref:Glycoside hydrolase 131 catalytic N-terminal domain-containing protein n=2 Tax=Pyrenophora teres f. teres TaxID=97479 RepID=E3REC1_PYRTT|nr:hypothetical protein PTT_04314 [Pyrenophora teres f. teres 0-1]KAE8822950.1 hypothetical protein PTNB85_10338 [Pyrenophora teres f. teres]KAE8832084.1 hypothetical protein HRS9139_06326 [Pyrenophora teres f. teres]KAE8835183.1 hypothetical protein HRS9122_07453 [Pyrenophora teres f. teres]KAE8858081.1 hypothetical protein PTNB29_07296 [Pyrenophora teres f. teres]
MLAKYLAVLSVAAIAHGRVVVVENRQAVAPVFDGRVKAAATAADFDTAASPFGKDNVKGQNLTFSQLIAFPDVPASLFDKAAGAKAIEVQINDQSIFVPGNVAANAQTAVRRTELNPNGGGNTTVGVKTLHVSLQPSAAHPLNISHEYLLTFLERADFGANLFQVRTGTLIGSDGSTKNDLVLQGNTAAGTKQLFTTPFTAGVWTNLALQLDFTANTIQVFKSTGTDALVKATEPLPNDLSGNGQFHFGVNKNPTNPGADVLRSGFQESGILEGVVYGGIFIEDSATGTVTLS